MGCADNRYFPEFAELLLGNRTSPQNFDTAVSQGDNCRFQAMHRGSGIDDERDQAVEFRANMLGCGWTEPTKPVGARRGEWAAESCADFSKNRVRAEPNGDGFKAGSDKVGDHRLSRKNKCQRAWPELFTQSSELIRN